LPRSFQRFWLDKTKLKILGIEKLSRAKYWYVFGKEYRRQTYQVCYRRTPSPHLGPLVAWDIDF
jgi:hypothetical protein